MNIRASIIDHSHANIEIRELFSFTKSSVEESVLWLKNQNYIDGALIISTCNRTEIYISTERKISPTMLLCELKNVDFYKYQNFFVELHGLEACKHLCRLSCGMESKIFGEDQIISQVKDSYMIAKEQNTLDYELELALKTSITTAKKVKSSIKLAKVETSLGDSTLNLVKQHFNKAKVLVIGNGEMGRIVAEKLVLANFDVTMTVRKYKKGEVIIPKGVIATDYDLRFEKICESDVIISATKSPHFTITSDKLPKKFNKKTIFIDLALPRDIENTIAEIPNSLLFDVDNFETKGSDAEILQAENVIYEAISEMDFSYKFKKMLPIVEKITDETSNYVSNRVKAKLNDDETLDFIEQTTKKAVSKIIYGLRDNLEFSEFEKCLEAMKIGVKN